MRRYTLKSVTQHKTLDTNSTSITTVETTHIPLMILIDMMSIGIDKLDSVADLPVGGEMVFKDQKNSLFVRSKP